MSPSLALRANDNTSLTVARIYQQLSNHEAFPVKTDDLSLKDRMFCEIVQRSIADVSGHLNLGAQSGDAPQASQARVTIGNVFTNITKTLGLAGIQKNNVLDFFLGTASSYTKGIVQTPHPTETLDRKAIAAEESLLHALEQEGKLLFNRQKKLGDINPEDRKELFAALNNLYNAITPVMKPLNIEEEISRSIIFSERMFDAVPMIAQRILASAKVHSRDLTEEQRQHFAHLLEPLTWSPGDQDSKPDMTIDQLETGFKKNRRAMMKHYAKQLASMLDTTDAPEPCKQALSTVISKLIRTAHAYEAEAELAGKPIDDYIDGVVSAKESEWNIDQATLERIKQSASQPTHSTPYDSKEAFITDLEALRQMDAADQKLNYLMPFHNGDSEHFLGALDALIIQAENFGLNALSSQIRQNRDVHERVFHALQKFVPENDLPSVMQMQGGALDANKLLDYLLDDAHPEHIQHMRNAIQRTLAEIGENAWIHSRQEAIKAGKEDDFYVYQTLKSLEFAANHPDFIPHYLIAECGYKENQDFNASVKCGADDMLSLLAMLKIMSPDTAKVPVEIVPLVEHPEQVMEQQGKIAYVETMKAVFENKHFRAHHQAASDAQYQHLLQHTTIEDGHVVTKPLTGNDVLASVNPEFNAKTSSSPSPVAMAKLCMGAGSDVTKFGGIAAAGLMQHAMHRLKEELATLEHPVLLLDYIGCGGGVHRTQPVSNNVETVQGRSMRQSSDAIATKTTALLARNLRDRLASDPDYHHTLTATDKEIGAFRREIPADERRALAQLNMGNLANLPRNPVMWENVSQPILQRAVQNYLDYTTGKTQPEYDALLSYSADMFCKLTSFAARPANRLKTAGGASVFPPEVKMSGLRAIGYGGLLNASGSSASLYLGLADAIKDVPLDTLCNAYLFEPKLQDTINRATYGIAMADLDTAWKYVGEKNTPSPETIAQLENSEPSASDRLALAKKALAHITQEYATLGQKLIEVHAKIAGKYTPKHIPQNAINSELTKLLPSALAYQINTSRHNIQPAREALANVFQEQLKKHADAVASSTEFKDISREDAIYKEVIYPAMSAIFECYEHAPRAYTSPHWAMGESKQVAAPQR